MTISYHGLIFSFDYASQTHNTSTILSYFPFADHTKWELEKLFVPCSILFLVRFIISGVYFFYTHLESSAIRFYYGYDKAKE